jgi:TolB-like protein
MIPRRFLHVLAASTALLSLGGCAAAFLNTAAHGIFIQDETNFAEKNYAVADYLIGQAKTYINRHHDVIKAVPLGDQMQPAMESEIGKMIPEQIGVRLSQLGYKLDLESVLTSEDLNYLKPAQGSTDKPDFILSGTFLRGRSDMDVSVRIIDAKNSRVIAAFDYKLPLTRQVNDLASPQPKIMRMEPQQ